MWGIDRLQTRNLSALRSHLSAKPCALLSHGAASDGHGTPTLTVLQELGVKLQRVFSPEHGFDGVAQAEEAVATPAESSLGGVDAPVAVSLYGSTKESLTPTAQHFADCEVLVVDLVDVGSRYYTYVWTALLALRAAAAQGIHTVVLDRPNPLGGAANQCEGKPQEAEFTSFVGLEPLPIRHGLTIGELLVHFAHRDGLQLGRDGALSVVHCEGWERHRTASAWGRPFIPPSPNMPSLETALLYPGGCLLEGSNLSEGRGTALPFRAVGAPFLSGNKLARRMSEAQLPGVQFRPLSFRPSFEKHQGEVCQGVLLSVTDEGSFRPVATALTLLCEARGQAPDHFQLLDRPYEFETEKPALDLLTGSAQTREALLAGANAQELIAALCPVPAAHAQLIAEAEAHCRAASA